MSRVTSVDSLLLYCRDDTIVSLDIFSVDFHLPRSLAEWNTSSSATSRSLQFSLTQSSHLFLGRPYLDIVSARGSRYGRRAFAVAGPTMFNALPDDLRDPAVSTTTWRHTFSLPISTFSALGLSHVMRYINVRYLLTYLLTYFSVLQLSRASRCMVIGEGLAGRRVQSIEVV